MFYTFAANRLEEMLNSDEAFESFLIDFDFSEVLDSETINELAYDAYFTKNANQDYLKRLIAEKWEKHKEDERRDLAESFADTYLD